MFSVQSRGPKDVRSIDDPLLREAVLDLFHANQAFTQVYARVAHAPPDDRMRALLEAERRVDAAREHVVDVQLRKHE